MKPQRVELAGLIGIGRTKGIAQRDLEHQIIAALDGDYSPRLLEWKGRQCVIWRTPQGLMSVYRYLKDYNEPVRERLSDLPGTCHYGNNDFESAVKSAALNLVMGDCDINSNVLPRLIAAWPGVIESFRTWLGYQRAFLHYKTNNPELTHNECHFHACNLGAKWSKGIVFDFEAATAKEGA